MQLAINKIKDEEIIAECKAKLGYTFFKIIKDYNTARKYLYESIVLIHSERNIHLSTEDWFIKCKNNLADIQKINGDPQIEFQKQY